MHLGAYGGHLPIVRRVTLFQTNCPANDEIIALIVSIPGAGDKYALEKRLKHECHE
jgi:hypothetical protein